MSLYPTTLPKTYDLPAEYTSQQLIDLLIQKTTDSEPRERLCACVLLAQLGADASAAEEAIIMLLSDSETEYDF